MVVLSEIESTFWGVCLESGKKYSQTSERNFHVSMAALDPSTNKGTEPVSVILEKNEIQYVLCSLVPGLVFQQTLDLNFSEGEDIVLYTKGKGTVHLTGYLHLDEELPPEAYDSDEDDESYDEEEGEEEEDDDEDDDDDPMIEAKKRKLKQKQLKMSKKAKVENYLDDEAEEAEEDEEDDDDEDVDEDEMGEGDEDDDEDDDDHDEEVDDSFLKKGKKKDKELKKKADVKEESKSPATSTNSAPSSEEKKKKKKKKKKNKNKSDAEDGGGAKENNTDAQSKPSTNQQTGKAKKFTAEGGVVIEEVKEGHGPPAKIGKHVKVYYTGKLQNGKIFDAKTSGDPFKFKLGKREVIAGWDVGLAGMKVGGKRKLTIPPKMGYGSRAAGRIPPNSTLVFDVELKAVL